MREAKSTNAETKQNRYTNTIKARRRNGGKGARDKTSRKEAVVETKNIE